MELNFFKTINFYDKFGNLETASIMGTSTLLTIYTSYKSIQTGTIKLHLGRDKVYVELIFVNPEFRGCGIGTLLVQLTDYVLKDYDNFYYYGVYSPFSRVMGDKIEQETRKFYNQNGFEILSKKAFKSNMALYPELSIKNFIDTELLYGNSIIFKRNNKKDSYIIKEDKEKIIDLGI